MWEADGVNRTLNWRLETSDFTTKLHPQIYTGQMGFEPTTSAVTGQRSKPLNYYPLKRGGRLEFCITNKGRALLQ